MNTWDLLFSFFLHWAIETGQLVLSVWERWVKCCLFGLPGNGKGWLELRSGDYLNEWSRQHCCLTGKGRGGDARSEKPFCWFLGPCHFRPREEALGSQECPATGSWRGVTLHFSLSKENNTVYSPFQIAHLVISVSHLIFTTDNWIVLLSENSMWMGGGGSRGRECGHLLNGGNGQRVQSCDRWHLLCAN